MITAESGPEALSILESNSIGLVVSDIQMEPHERARIAWLHST